MKRFHCHCGNEVFFENTHCTACGSQLGFDPSKGELLTLMASSEASKKVIDTVGNHYLVCEHRQHALLCNWLLPPDSENGQCISCRLTRVIPMQSYPQNVKRWSVLESAKRRMVYGLLQLNLRLRYFRSVEGQERSMVFDFLEDKRSNPDVDQELVYSGHVNGVITINVAEADSSYREATREAMNEPYRTLLGHFRHETGHYYWDQLIVGSEYSEGFKSLFGDHTLPYRETMNNYYANGPASDWQTDYISAYASAHPLEDWAETWAHYLLMHETLETAVGYGLVKQLTDQRLFDAWMGEWMQLVVVLNALNRSIGNVDAYPFVISERVHKKLRFVHEVILQAN